MHKALFTPDYYHNPGLQKFRMEENKRLLISEMLLEMKAILYELDIDYLMIGPIKADTSFKMHKFEPMGRNKKLHMTITCGDELKSIGFKNALINTGQYSTTPQNTNALFYKKGIELNVLHKEHDCSDEIYTKINRNVFVMRSECLEKAESAVNKFFFITS